MFRLLGAPEKDKCDLIPLEKAAQIEAVSWEKTG
jgi:hypothetical protein